MVASSHRRSLDTKGLLAVSLVVAYLALVALWASVGIDAASQVLEPIERVSSDSPTTTDSAVSLGGNLLP
jgi:hypothetical protein